MNLELGIMIVINKNACPECELSNSMWFLKLDQKSFLEANELKNIQ